MRIAVGVLLLGVVSSGCGGGSVTLPLQSAQATPEATATPVSSATPGSLYVGATPTTIAVYSTAASGNVGPSRLVAGATPISVNAGAIWALNDAYPPLYPSALPAAYATATHYASNGSVLNALHFVGQYFSTGTTAGATDSSGNIYLANGTLEREPTSIDDPECQFEGDATISEYAANATQSSVPIRSIAVTETCSIFSLAFDREGHLWVGGASVLDEGVNGEYEIPSISEYAVGAGASGTRLRTLVLSQGYLINIALDSTDRVYSINDDQLIRYDSNLQHPQVLLAAENSPDAVFGVQTADRIAIDAHDIVYIFTEASQSQRLSIREFAFPSTKPIRVITGANAAIGGAGLVVTR